MTPARVALLGSLGDVRTVKMKRRGDPRIDAGGAAEDDELLPAEAQRHYVPAVPCSAR